MQGVGQAVASSEGRRQIVQSAKQFGKNVLDGDVSARRELVAGFTGLASGAVAARQAAVRTGRNLTSKGIAELNIKEGNTIETLVAAREGARSVVPEMAETQGKGKYARRTNINHRSADEINATFPEGWAPPYKPNTRVTEFTNTVDDVYVRVHGESNMARSWMMKREAVSGLKAQEIKSKYTLPELPSFMSEVHVPAGTRIRTGKVNPVFEGVGNATQYELLQRLPVSAFKNTVRIE